jgi:signal transduction histidine kinase
VSHSGLIVTAAEGIESCVAELKSALRLDVETASSRRAALHALTRREFTVLILDQALIEADPEGADILVRQAGLAIPVQVSLALSSPGRVVREVKAALLRREQELALSMRAAAAAVDQEIKNGVTGLMLQAQLAQDTPGLPVEARDRIHTVVLLADKLRRKLEVSQP